MANPKHLALVRRGAAAIAEWRRAHPRARLDLREADLRGTDLRGANFGWADLAGANLTGANLHGADLSLDDLTRANLSRAKLWEADLSLADLTDANLSRAELWGAKLLWADLARANLSRAKLTEANLSRADLTGADLSRAKLTEANLSQANLAGTNLSQAILGWTSVGEVGLSRVQGLATVKHLRPSSVGVDTLIRSFRGAGNTLTPDLVAFFRGAGVPQELLAALPAILAEVKYCSCFICYGEPDLGFAGKLWQDLTAGGVSCWLYPEDYTVGKRTWGEIGQKRREAEEMVVLCSAAALIRPGVLKEIEEQIDEEPEKMVPISLDDLWKEKGFKVLRGDRDLKPFLLDKNYADFARLLYEEALGKLLEGLKRSDT